MAEGATPNFIHILLCDNDYGQHLERAAKVIYEVFGNNPIYVEEARIKKVVVDLVVVYESMHAAANKYSSDYDFDVSRGYLMSQLEVKFSDVVPNVDHDGGSVAIDRNTGYIWRF
jgi:hypothetical protein